ncbi:MAG: helix-turn-helix domain-containing protein, partial [Lachnospiraceae bacterium]
MGNLEKLIRELIRLSDETPWVEFKHNNYEPEMIGKDISALANSAALYEKSCAYMIWGIQDETHEIIGTEYNLQNL